MASTCPVTALCMCVLRILHYLHVGLRITITQSHKHTMQQTRTHKAVTRCVEAKKLLSRRRQSEYSMVTGADCCCFFALCRRGLNPPHRVKSISMASYTPQEIEYLQKHGNEVRTLKRSISA